MISITSFELRNSCEKWRLPNFSCSHSWCVFCESGICGI